MKRSEVLSAICEYLRGEYGPSMVEGIGDVTFARAVTVLDICEDMGMRPPYDASQDDGVDTMEWEPE
jgi:hypothetical protein